MTSLKCYSIKELISIIPYQFCYKLLLKWENVLLNYSPKKWIILPPVFSINYNLFDEFYKRCNSNEKEIVAIADKLLEGEYVTFGFEYHFDHNKDWLKDPVSGICWNNNTFFSTAPTVQEGCADVKYVLELNKFNELVQVALAYYYTGNEKYICYIDEAIIAWRTVVKPGKSIACRIMMDLGFRIINLIQVILLCKDSIQFKEQTLPLILGIIEEHVNRIYKFSTPRWFKTGNGVNHVTGEMIGLIIGQLFLERCGIGNFSKKYPVEYKYLIEALERTIAPSGAYLEQSSNYARVVTEFLICFDIMRDALGHRAYCSAYNEGNYTSRLLQYLKDLSYHDTLPNFGDNDDARVLIAFREKGQEVDYLFKGHNVLGDLGKYLDGSQWVYRSNDDTDVYIFTRVGKFTYLREGAGVHAHNDILSILLNLKGRQVFIDKGCLFYNSGLDIRKIDRMIFSHNTVSLSGIEMNCIGNGFYFNYPYSTFIDRTQDDNIIFEGLLSYYGVNHIRKIRYLKDRIIINDEIRTDFNQNKEGTINYLLHPDIKALKLNDESIFLFDESGLQIANIRLEGVNMLQIMKVDYSPSYAVNKKTSCIVGEFSLNDIQQITTYIDVI